MFPDNFTIGVGSNIMDRKRAFLMGNALVVGVVERIGTSLSELIIANDGKGQFEFNKSCHS